MALDGDSKGYNRPEGGYRFKRGSLKTNTPADAMQPDEYPYLQNVRFYQDDSAQTRPGYEKSHSTAASAILSMRAITQPDLGGIPIPYAVNASGAVYYNNVLAGSIGATNGHSLIPFRPAASPLPWMYIGNSLAYKKYGAPFPYSSVTEHLAGIEEQHEPPLAAPDSMGYIDWSDLAADWTPSGVAGATADLTTNYTLGAACIEDPATVGTPTSRWSVETTPGDLYGVGLIGVFDPGGTPYTAVVQDVLPAINDGVALTIQSIFYFVGTTGRCVIVPTESPVGGVPTFTDNIPDNASIFQTQILSTLRRGSLVSLNGSETVFVESVTTGPNGQVCFECTTVGTFVATDTITGLPAISVSDIAATVGGTDVDFESISSAVGGAGSAIFTNTFGTNPFNSLFTPSGRAPQPDDIISFYVNLDTVNEYTSIKLSFTLSAVGDALEFTTTPATEIGTAATAAVITPILIQFPISALTRVGNNPQLTLANCTGAVLTLVATAAGNVYFGHMLVLGGGQPDVGETGSPYFYAIRGRSSLTGAVSNPSPITRYGVSPRRQQVILQLTDTNADVQMDTWDIFRFGGSVLSWRYIGSVNNTVAVTELFTDDYTDAAALAGPELEYDNFQPWPSIDVPFIADAGTVAGITTTLSVIGDIVLVVYSAAAPFTDPAPDTILRWLPGTLILIDGLTAYTLWARPELVTLAAPPAADYYAYMFQLVENAGADTPNIVSVLEPNVANQPLPYLFGPDAQGTVFGCGDTLRPGNIYYSKPYNPDSAPDTNNIELVPPSEPLQGGQVLNGLAFVSSSNRWFALYPQLGNSTPGQEYQAVEKPFGRALAAPYGSCTDGKRIYWWAKDGIWMSGGDQGVSLTDKDLYNLFPHDGDTADPSDIIYASKIIAAPSYQYSDLFRLTFVNGMLYALYRDSGRGTRMLVCDLTNPEDPVWLLDVYGDDMSSVYASEQPEVPRLFYGDTSGDVHIQTSLHNDDLTSIPAFISVFEFNGGDLRADQLFNDMYLDIRPVSGINATPESDRLATSIGTVAIAATVTRIQTNIPVGLELKYMGILLGWTDNFLTQSIPTELYAFQPMYQGVPVKVFLWKTQATSFGMKAYGHIRQVNFCYKSTEEVTLTVTVGTSTSGLDGQSPAVITLPSTSGLVRKIMLPFSANKGMIYFFTGRSTDAQWQPYLSETEFFVGDWERSGPYRMIQDIDAAQGIRS